MKKCFAFFLIICLLINICGCYPSTTILKEDYSGYISDSEKDLRITLRDGRTIISKSYEHLTVYEPSEFIIGKATITGLGEPELNVGTILLKSQIDSTNMNNGLNIYNHGNCISRFADSTYCKTNYTAAIPGDKSDAMNRIIEKYNYDISDKDTDMDLLPSADDLKFVYDALENKSMYEQSH